MPADQPVEASFRDPAGCCFAFDERLLRWVGQEHCADFEGFLQTEAARRWSSSGRLVSTRALSEGERNRLAEDPRMQSLAGKLSAGRLFEHERLPFPSFPYEWPVEMLFAAGELTLELAQEALAHGYGLKDATPYNVLFRGNRPVFIDLLSFERRQAGDSVWTPYGQFVRTFLLPLLAHRHYGVRPADVFITHRDGLEPEEVFRWASPLRRLAPRFLGLVTLPTVLARRGQDAAVYRPRIESDSEKARFILDSLFGRLRRVLASLRPRAAAPSTWSTYMDTHSYSEVGFAAKEAFVRNALEEFRPRAVLDVGANTGHFSALAATMGARVVAVDSDAACVGRIWARAREKHLDLLPLVVDFSRPSPPIGWRNRECPSFLERATGGFDGVFLLAVLHHLLVTERLPLEQIIELAASLTTRVAVIEFVGPADSQFQRLLRGRDALHAHLTPAAFEAACQPWFEVLRSQRLDDSHRSLYLLRRK